MENFSQYVSTMDEFKKQIRQIMKERILTGWTLMRALYLVMGITLTIQAVMSHQNMLIALGVYFGAMAIFGIGCAGGRCAVPAPNKNKTDFSEEVTFEEVK